MKVYRGDLSSSKDILVVSKHWIGEGNYKLVATDWEEGYDIYQREEIAPLLFSEHGHGYNRVITLAVKR